MIYAVAYSGLHMQLGIFSVTLNFLPQSSFWNYEPNLGHTHTDRGTDISNPYQLS